MELKDFEALKAIHDDDGRDIEVFYLKSHDRLADDADTNVRGYLTMGLEFTMNHVGLGDNIKDLFSEHYASLGIIKTKAGPEKIYMVMQGNNWSPNLEARDLIQGKGLRHTTMSIGDAFKVGGKHYLVDNYGFKCLEKALSKDKNKDVSLDI